MTRSAMTMSPAHVPSTGMPCRDPLADRLDQAVAERQLADRRGLARPGSPGRRRPPAPRRCAPRRGWRPERGAPRVLAEVSLQRENARLHDVRYQPRVWSRPSSPRVAISMPRIGSPRPREIFASWSGSLKYVVASTIARARGAGSSRLEDARARRTRPRRRAASSARRRPASRGRRRRSSRPAACRPRRPGGPARAARPGPWPATRAPRPEAPRSLAICVVIVRMVADGLDDVARAGLALGADHRRALGDPAQGLAQVAGAAHERHRERPTC